jgi:ABC-type Fe3+ transport system permease subunit
MSDIIPLQQRCIGEMQWKVLLTIFLYLNISHIRYTNTSNEAQTVYYIFIVIGFIACYMFRLLGKPSQKTTQRTSNETYKNNAMNSWSVFHYCYILILCSESPQFFQTSRSHLKIIGAKREKWDKFHTQDPQISGATVQYVAVPATWCMRFLHPFFVLYVSVAHTRCRR